VDLSVRDLRLGVSVAGDARKPGLMSIGTQERKRVGAAEEAKSLA